MTRSSFNVPLGERARRALAAGLDAVEARSAAPLRLQGHLARADVDLFELREERELGGPGRRFLVSVDHARSTMVVLTPGAA